MKNETTLTEAGQQYAKAYDAQYKTKDIPKAFVLYERLITMHPDSQEAEYAESQIQNIVKAVIPKHKIAEALRKLISAHFKQEMEPVA